MPATAQNSTKTSIEQSRILIRQEKAEIESSYKEKESVCLKRFVATPCIDDAKLQKTKALAKIKQRELELNEQERVLKKAKIEGKQNQSPTGNAQSPTQTPMQIKSTDAPSSSESTSEEKANNEQLQKQQQKQAQAQTQAKLRAEKTELKKFESAKKANRRSIKSNQESANSAKYQSKIAAAQARKNAVEEKNANRSKPKAAPLPPPLPASTAATSATKSKHPK